MAWAVVRDTVFILEYIFFFLSIVGLFLYRCIRRHPEYPNIISSRMSDQYFGRDVTNSPSYTQIGTRSSAYTGVQMLKLKCDKAIPQLSTALLGTAKPTII
jgi:hypothetical protein